MGDNSIFIVFSNIWSPVHLKIHPQFQASWQHRLFTLDIYGQFIFFLNDSFSFYLSIDLLLVFLYLIAASNRVLLLYACAHKISLKYLFPEKIPSEICCQKCQECNTFCVTNFFPFNFKSLSNKKY